MMQDQHQPVVIAADLHTHTTCSDGVLSVPQLLERAEAQDLIALAITDHDTVHAHHEIRRIGYNGSLRIIPGIEVSCYEHGRDIHVLGYFVNIDDPDLMAFAERQHAERFERASAMVERLRHFRQPITMDEVLAQAAGAPIGRPHIAAVLVKRGLVTNLQQAFDLWLDEHRQAYVPKKPFSVLQAVTMIRAAGGFSSIAHPMRTFSDPRMFLNLMASGIDGVEVYHPAHHFVTREYYRVLAKQHGLLVTGGSDFHGTRTWDDRNFGKFGLTYEALDTLYAGLHARNISI